ncbi:Histidine biosynthesis trifunctional protein [Hondaea fermentalgiana]|uniref:Histidine biosynthesis trifunctional protein n=1 Tax=Hondaea fermentalgiana TaxID=2315210 RepID=A0A2R5GVC6_9STRA|nr:Histidine biosynthesis trifunctional protein [Hondaea fermentalgiana]|eukprot:GBG32351.1 Histidine biosynthesis trifunctional protein [Hondaea fermentalgiana]
MVAHKEEERMLIKAKRRARTARHHRALAVRNALRDLSNFVPKNAHLVILPTSPASSTASSTTATSASPLPSPLPCSQRLHPFTPSPTPSPRTLALATPPRLETIPSIAEYLPDGQFAQHDRDELEAILALLECPSAECRSKSNVGLQPPPSPVQTLSAAGSEVDFGAADEEEKPPDAMTSHDGDPHPLRCSHDDTTDSTGGIAKIQADRDLASAHIESRDCNKNNKSQERDQGHGDISAESEKSEEMPFPFISFEMCDRESNAHIQVQAVQRRASLNATLHEIMNIEEDQEKRNELISEMEGFLSGEMQDTSVYTLSSHTMLIPTTAVVVGGEKADAAEVLARVEKLSWCGPVRLVPELAESATPPAREAEDEKKWWKCAVHQWARALYSYPCQVGPIEAGALEEITQWLNHGALQVILDGSLEELAEVAEQLPKERLVARLKADDLSEDAVEKLLACVGGISVVSPASTAAEVIETAERAWGLVGKRLTINIEAPELASGSEAQKENNPLIGKLHSLHSSDYPVSVSHASVSLPGKDAAVDVPDSDAVFCLGRALVSCLRTDRTDGLYATVVADEFGVALGLVYSSSASILASLECGRGVYWSRSRQSLWRKGDTSGAFQELVNIAFDCDADALRFKVRQRGEPPAFCHQQTRTCWGYDGGIPHLFRTLESRKQNAPEGSYTKRLFDDRALLRNKLIEESQEVVEAVEEEDSEHVAEEVADLAYFLFTACSSGNATLEDVVRQLDMRSLKVKRRPGNAKAHRIAAGDAVLKAQSEPPANPEAK